MHIVFCIMIMLAAVLLADIIGKFFPRVPTPILQIILGVLITFLPISHGMEIEHEIFHFLFVAPLAYYGGMEMNKKVMWQMKKSVANMAVLLVILSGILVGGLIHALIPAVSLATAFTLMASLSPTDHIAVDNVERHSHVPENLMEMLKGESVVAEVTSVILFQVGLSYLTTSHISVGHTILEFLWLLLGGIIVGVVLSLIKIVLVQWLCIHGIKSQTIHTLLGVLFPILVYLIAEMLEVSGVLAIFIAGMMSSFEYNKAVPDTTHLTIASKNIWQFLTFSLDGLVFVYLGMEIPELFIALLDESFGVSIGWIIVVILLISLALFTIRFLWGFLTLPKNVREVKEGEAPLSRVRTALIFSMSGARGAITMATVSSIPVLMSTGEAFPNRELMLIIAMGVIICSVLVSYIILPFVAPVHHHEKGKVDDEIMNEILQTVITRLEHEATADNFLETQFMIQNYRDLQKVLKIRNIDEEQHKFDTVIFDWESANLEKMVNDGEVTEKAAKLYLHSAEQKQKKNRHANLFPNLRMIFGLQKIKHDEQEKTKTVEAFLKIKKSNTEYVLKQLQQQTEFSQVLCENKKAELLNFLEILEELDKNERTDRQTIEQDVLADVALCSMNMERDAIQEMYEAGKISYGTSVSMKNDITLLELQME